MLNNRRFIRCSYSYGAAVQNENEEWKEITVENISAGGLNFLIKTAKFRSGEELNFKLEVESPDKSNIMYTTKAKGKIVRMTSREDGRFEYGVEFTQKDMSTLGEIIRFAMA
ncbi:MAG: PilZ domain-containing protein [Oscillospiraceae bacterium]|nr:PilZ domain-containing protein [Oscillospiraceae bacterium]